MPFMFQSDLLLNKRILITGGGTGLGKAAAQRFLELGAEVYICGRREEVLAATVRELRERTGGRIHSRRCDVRDAGAVEEMMGVIWNDGPLDVLMNNAAGNFLARTEELSSRRVSICDRHRAHGVAAHDARLRETLARRQASGSGVECDDHIYDDRARLMWCHRRWRRLECRLSRAVSPSSGATAAFA